jgi:D-serine deaminase-like pyridoxal phosphate-dependent protein|eukprot:COSAG06_NODE_10481_length_1674_cov_1.898413_2_plen_195_part_00
MQRMRLTGRFNGELRRNGLRRLPPLLRARRYSSSLSVAATPCARVPSSDYERQLTPGLVARTPTPALFVFMDAVRENVATMLRHCGGDPLRWRPHLKTTKMSPVYEALLEAGVRKFKCATLKEATVLLELVTKSGTEGVDLLVAYPHVEPTLSLLSGLASSHSSVQLSVLVEDAEGTAAVHNNLGIWVDVNVGA